MYINDLPDICIHFANIYLFADDAKLYKHVLFDKLFHIFTTLTATDYFLRSCYDNSEKF